MPFAHLPKYNLFAPPPPLQKNCISIVLSLSWEEYDAQEQEKVNTKVLHILGGSKVVYYVER